MVLNINVFLFTIRINKKDTIKDNKKSILTCFLYSRPKAIHTKARGYKAPRYLPDDDTTKIPSNIGIIIKGIHMKAASLYFIIFFNPHNPTNRYNHLNTTVKYSRMVRKG